MPFRADKNVTRLLSSHRIAWHGVGTSYSRLLAKGGPLQWVLPWELHLQHTAHRLCGLEMHQIRDCSHFSIYVYFYVYFVYSSTVGREWGG